MRGFLDLLVRVGYLVEAFLLPRTILLRHRQVCLIVLGGRFLLRFVLEDPMFLIDFFFQCLFVSFPDLVLQQTSIFSNYARI